MTCYNKIKGGEGESMACQFLEARGFKIVMRNFSCRSGEIDIIATKDDAIHFVEVKTRTGDFIAGRCAVNAVKQRHIKASAAFYLRLYHLGSKHFCSFDVIEITGDKIEFLENCFY